MSPNAERLLVSFSCDTEGPEPEFWLNLYEGGSLETLWNQQPRRFDEEHAGLYSDSENEDDA
jgi:hypothetical protein